MLNPALTPLVAFVLATAASCASCQKDEMKSAAPASEVAPKVHVAVAGGEQTVMVEVVREEEELRRGLMYRRQMDADKGMLFLMGEERVHTFWMKNTYIPLDMIFIAKDMTIAGVVENVPPETLEHRFVDAPSVYVLEVNAGWSRRHGVRAGAKVRFENVSGF